jgi:hypothetical protein
LKRQGIAIQFRVRATPEWKKHAGDLEHEMLRRGMSFEIIDWSEDQATLSFDAREQAKFVVRALISSNPKTN